MCKDIKELFSDDITINKEQLVSFIVQERKQIIPKFLPKNMVVSESSGLAKLSELQDICGNYKESECGELTVKNADVFDDWSDSDQPGLNEDDDYE